MITTWRKEFAEIGVNNPDALMFKWKGAPALDVEFDCGFGGENGQPFIAWSASAVYFASCYDGSEWVGAVPRNPEDACCYTPTHLGG